MFGVHHNKAESCIGPGPVSRVLVPVWTQLAPAPPSPAADWGWSGHWRGVPSFHQLSVRCDFICIVQGKYLSITAVYEV